ncbi:MAG: VWA domain-containing protein [Desulfosporosinus sp.]|nr:VWA domain-containing protein [Desulfosporosinus sp.]
MKQRLVALLAIMILILLGLSVSTQASTTSNAVQHFDIVFVIDDSGSMKQTDPNRLRVEALKRFVDILPKEGDQVGVVTYSTEVLETMSLRDIRSESDKNDIKKFAETKITQNGGWTDTAVGLKQAAAYLDEFKKVDHKQLIILVTDGANDFGDTGRTKAQSDADLEKVIAKKYPIYTIGLNPEDQKYENYISDIAKRTDAKAYFPKSADDLQAIFYEIQGLMYGTELTLNNVNLNPSDYKDVEIDIPKGVFEANIQIIHTAPLESKLIAPNGDEIDHNMAGFIFTTESSYTNIKLSEPEAGKWKLRLKGSKEETVSYSVLFNYDITKNAQATQNNSSRFNNIVKWISVVIGLLAAALIMLLLLKKRSLKTPPHGQLKVIVMESFIPRATEWRKLGNFSNDASMDDILGCEDIFHELKDVKIRGTYEGIMIINSCGCDIRYRGKNNDPAGVEITDGQSFRIILSDKITEIEITYSAN